MKCNFIIYWSDEKHLYINLCRCFFYAFKNRNVKKFYTFCVIIKIILYICNVETNKKRTLCLIKQD